MSVKSPVAVIIVGCLLFSALSSLPARCGGIQKKELVNRSSISIPFQDIEKKGDGRYYIKLTLHNKKRRDVTVSIQIIFYSDGEAMEIVHPIKITVGKKTLVNFELNSISTEVTQTTITLR